MRGIVDVEPLAMVEAGFQRLVERLEPLDVKLSGDGLPTGPLDLVELRALLLHPSMGRAERAVVWRRIVELASGPGEMAREWQLAAIGLVLPGLRRVALRYRREVPGGQGADVQQVVLEGAWRRLRELCAQQPLVEVPSRVPARLVWAGERAAELFRRKEERRARPIAAVPVEALPSAGRVRPGDGAGAERLLVLAAEEGFLDRETVRMLVLNRLEGVPMRELAAEAGVSQQAMSMRRKRAEEVLRAAIASGELSLDAVALEFDC